MAAAAIRVQALPGQMQRLIEAIGLAATERLLAARGGRRLHRPAEPAQWERDANLLGSREVVEALWSAFPEHSWIDLPTPKKLEALRRNDEIRAAARSGTPVPRIAEEHRMTSRYVRMIISEG